MFDDGTTERILGFSTDELITALCRAPIVYMDGTFRIVPTIFAQLYTLHAFYKGQMLPMAYFLLPNKEKETYKRMFQLLRSYTFSLNQTFRPVRFQIDYESSVLEAITEIFPEADRKGCFFHFLSVYGGKCRGSGCKLTTRTPQGALTTRRSRSSSDPSELQH